MNTEAYNPNDYIFFWGTYMSNFYTAKFVVDGVQYNCSEQYFMKKKQEMFDSTNTELANLILNETDPKKIKKYGRQVKNFDKDKWDQHRYEIMKRGVYEKFNQNDAIKYMLKSTETKTLVEASPRDCIWGIGLGEVRARVTHPTKWRGKNLLGKVLMEVRQQLNTK